MQLPLVKSLAPLLQAECAGLESGNAPILEKVTPVTADLLRWWFQQDCCDTPERTTSNNGAIKCAPVKV
jgi:type III restriction enzyme